jgi:thymidine phosphorylase
VGIILHKKTGDRVSAGEPLCTVHYNSAERFEQAAPLIQQSYRIEPTPLLQKRPLVRQIIGDRA